MFREHYIPVNTCCERKQETHKIKSIDLRSIDSRLKWKIENKSRNQIKTSLNKEPVCNKQRSMYI